ncbi:hypothetical protein jhhlp_001768 [Lomentospora prolificans]|uniref:Uncharacterized protein n=1 Tax=Lomentospora prolificans TaxID=41688 RepID=A0A2N3NGT5_9PEZI|nr:hypothetical protein jhhlp_001768 [Lomentospora prolificans]
MLQQQHIRGFIKQVLLWAIFQQESLKIDEFNIGQALGLYMDRNPEAEVTDTELEALLDDNIQAMVGLYCSQLVHFQDGRLQFVYKSRKTYLITGEMSGLPAKLNFQKEESHALLADICIAYLTMSCFENPGDTLENGALGIIYRHCGAGSWKMEPLQRRDVGPKSGGTATGAHRKAIRRIVHRDR